MLPSILAGKFAVDRQIGIGGMGVVYQAHDLDLGRPVALKTLPKVAPRHVARLRREARAMATIQHPHLAVIYAIEVWRGLPVLVIEYLSGRTLADRLDGTPLPIGDALAMGIAMADVLDHVHRAGMLHRDVKPRNIGYTGDGTPKLLDFGLVRLTSVSVAPDDTTSLAVLKDAAAAEAVRRGESFGATQPLVGTAAYLSPEAVSLQAPDNSFDLWALAVTLYEAVSGRNPFAASTPVEILQRITSAPIPPARSLRRDCPEALNEFLSSALSRDLRKRPGTAAEFLEDLRAVQRAHAAPVGGAAVAG
jgi:serine/threonine-protein kinase